VCQCPEFRLPEGVGGNAGLLPARRPKSHRLRLCVSTIALSLTVLLPGVLSTQEVAASTSHDMIYVATHGRFEAINAATDKVTRTTSVRGISTVGAIVVSPNLRTAYLLSDNKILPIQLTGLKSGSSITIGPPTSEIALTQVGLPTSIALSPNGNTAYVPVPARGVLVPVNLDTRRAETPINLGGQPQSVAISPDAGTAYVTNSGLQSVQAVDLKNGTITGTFPNISDPADIVISPNGKSAYVSNASLRDGGINSSVVPLNLTTLTESAPIDVGSPSRGYAPESISLSPSGNRVYVANTSSATNSTPVVEINVNTGKVIGVLGAFSHPISISSNSAGSQLFVANGALPTTSFPGPTSTVRSPSVVVIDLRTRRIEARIKLGRPPSAIASWSDQ
jgi:DNA-binding beta-propeller fold protein YncE